MWDKETPLRLKERFQDAVIEIEETRGEVSVRVSSQKVVEVLKYLKEENSPKYQMLVDLFGVDYPQRDKRFEVVYLLHSLENNHRLRVKTQVGEGEPLGSACKVWRGANWLEREVYDMLGIKFEGHPDLRRILTWEGFKGYPLRKDFPLEGEEDFELPSSPPDLEPPKWFVGEGEKYFIVNMGPQHPSTHGVLRVILKLEGEGIVDALPVIGHLHRGVEKLGENMKYLEALTLTDRLDYTAAFSNNLAYMLAVEKLFGVEPPKRAQYIRVMLAEFSRLSSHLLWLATHALDIGAMTVYFYCFREREKILEIVEDISGARLTPSFLRIGGVAKDLPEGVEEKIEAFVKEFPSRIKEYETLLTKNPIWLKRTKGIGVLEPGDAIDYGVTGPPLRGSGVKWDVRKALPYSSYEEFDFEIPIGEIGDTYDRYLVRLEEMRQSTRIIDQALKKIKETPPGEILVDDPYLVPPSREIVEKEPHALLRHFKYFSEGPSPLPGEAYMSVEGPKGELGWYLVSDGSPRPYRFRVRPPTFMNLQVLPLMTRGHLVADVVAVIGSIDIVLGEIDR